MNRLKKGFTLIELLVVIAIIGILATTLAPKLREQLAKAKDAKGIAVLGAARTAGEVLFVDKLVQSTGGAVSVSLTEIHAKLDDKAQAVVTTAGAATIGGSRTAANGGTMGYGGTVSLNLAMTTTSESLTLNFEDHSSKGATYKFSTEGKEWVKY